MDDLHRNAPLDEETLVDLIRRAQQGRDPSAFDGLYVLYANRIFRYLLVRAGAVDLAEDVTAQVFLRLLEKIVLYQIASQDNVAIFSAWLYRLAHNRLIDVVRKQKRNSTFSLDSVQFVPEKRSVIESSDERIDFELIMGKVQLLSDQQRQVILLRFVEGYSLAETAEILQKNEGAIKALQHRALENLRRYLEHR
jgi:RNA polymerase sigma-70 factor (ECF subfamily)